MAENCEHIAHPYLVTEGEERGTRKYAGPKPESIDDAVTEIIDLYISSNLIDVPIELSHPDRNGLSNGITDFSREYECGCCVLSLTAPDTWDGQEFRFWQVGEGDDVYIHENVTVYNSLENGDPCKQYYKAVYGDECVVYFGQCPSDESPDTVPRNLRMEIEYWQFRDWGCLTPELMFGWTGGTVRSLPLIQADLSTCGWWGETGNNCPGDLIPQDCATFCGCRDWCDNQPGNGICDMSCGVFLCGGSRIYETEPNPGLHRSTWEHHGISYRYEVVLDEIRCRRQGDDMVLEFVGWIGYAILIWTYRKCDRISGPQTCPCGDGIWYPSGGGGYVVGWPFDYPGGGYGVLSRYVFPATQLPDPCQCTDIWLLNGGEFYTEWKSAGTNSNIRTRVKVSW